jgi:hypothetical protein
MAKPIFWIETPSALPRSSGTGTGVTTVAPRGAGPQTPDLGATGSAARPEQAKEGCAQCPGGSGLWWI